MNARGGVLLLAASLGCGAPTERPSEPPGVSAHAKQAASAMPGESAATCTVSGKLGLFADEIQLVDSTGALLARVQSRAGTERVDLLNSERSARAALDQGPIHLEGRVVVSAHPWVLSERRNLIDDHLFAPAGIGLRVLEVRASGVRVEARAPFEHPKTIEIPCESLAFDAASDAPRSTRDPELAMAKRPRQALRIFDRPRGRVVLAEPVPDPFVVLEEREGFAHVRLGTLVDACEQGLIADGWVVAEDIAPSPEPTDRDDVCDGVLDSFDSCPNATITRAADLFIAGLEGDHPRRFGRVEGSARVEVVAAPKGRLTPIRLTSLEVNPPRGQALFVESSALTRTCSTLRQDPDDDCPCDP